MKLLAENFLQCICTKSYDSWFVVDIHV